MPQPTDVEAPDAGGGAAASTKPPRPRGAPRPHCRRRAGFGGLRSSAGGGAGCCRARRSRRPRPHSPGAAMMQRLDRCAPGVAGAILHRSAHDVSHVPSAVWDRPATTPRGVCAQRRSPSSRRGAARRRTAPGQGRPLARCLPPTRWHHVSCRRRPTKSVEVGTYTARTKGSNCRTTWWTWASTAAQLMQP